MAESNHTRTTAVLIPVKDFARAKVRLAPDVSPDRRAALAEQMATIVVEAARPLDVAVVCDAESVRAWAERVDVRVIWTPGLGLNGAVETGVARLANEGVDTAVVAHSDLPLAEDLSWIGATAGVTIIPDRRGDGSNVLAVPTRAGFTFCYGAGSFAAHCAEARRLGLQLRIVSDERLGWDVDVPGDLDLPDGAIGLRVP